MSRPDATASAALGDEVVKPVYFAFADFLNEPVRANTSGRTIAVTGVGDPDLYGQTFDGLSGDLVDVGPVGAAEGGSKTLTVRLSALIDLDNDLLNEIGDPANWQGRTFRMWRMIRDCDGLQQGAIQHYYTGYMVDLTIDSSPGNQIMTLEIEGYVAAFSDASNRTYLDQEDFDPGDLSAAAALGSANGTSGNSIVNNTPGGGSRDSMNPGERPQDFREF